MWEVDSRTRFNIKRIKFLMSRENYFHPWEIWQNFKVNNVFSQAHKIDPRPHCGNSWPVAPVMMKLVLLGPTCVSVSSIRPHTPFLTGHAVLTCFLRMAQLLLWPGVRPAFQLKVITSAGKKSEAFGSTYWVFISGAKHPLTLREGGMCFVLRYESVEMPKTKMWSGK